MSVQAKQRLLARLAAKTASRCHLCHGDLDPDLHGPPGAFGDDTVNIDHLLPRADGGGDEEDNLRLAHAVCNQHRGTRNAEDVRLDLAGTPYEPSSRATRIAAGLGLAVASAAFAAELFSSGAPDGRRKPSSEAGVAVGLGVFLLSRALL